jgi:hypothetical protein
MDRLAVDPCQRALHVSHTVPCLHSVSKLTGGPVLAQGDLLSVPVTGRLLAQSGLGAMPATCPISRVKWASAERTDWRQPEQQRTHIVLESMRNQFKTAIIAGLRASSLFDHSGTPFIEWRGCRRPYPRQSPWLFIARQTHRPVDKTSWSQILSSHRFPDRGAHANAFSKSQYAGIGGEIELHRPSPVRHDEQVDIRDREVVA